MRRWYARLVAAGHAVCARCGEPIAPDAKWHLDHDDLDKSRYLGPSHARCNLATARHRAQRKARKVSREW